MCQELKIKEADQAVTKKKKGASHLLFPSPLFLVFLSRSEQATETSKAAMSEKSKLKITSNLLKALPKSCGKASR